MTDTSPKTGTAPKNNGKNVPKRQLSTPTPIARGRTNELAEQWHDEIVEVAKLLKTPENAGKCAAYENQPQNLASVLNKNFRDEFGVVATMRRINSETKTGRLEIKVDKSAT